jgi:hypothetical protein
LCLIIAFLSWFGVMFAVCWFIFSVTNSK